jgi:hypothetical protein
MTLKRPHQIVEPAIEAAWRWLLACPTATSPHEVRRRAGLARLDPERRRVVDHALGYLTRRALRRGPPDRLALAGLGEIAARSTCDIEPLIVRALRARRPRPPGSVLVTFAGTGAWPDEDRERHWRAISLEQLMAGKALNQPLVDQASYLLDHPWELRSRAYGLNFVIRVALQVSPASTLTWLATYPKGTTVPLLKAIGHVVGRSRHAGPLIEALLRCHSPLLRVMGARALGKSGWEDRDPAEMAATYGRLVAAGWSRTDAHWIVAQRLKDLLHRRFGARRHVTELEFQRARDFRSPDAPRLSWEIDSAKAAARRMEEAKSRLAQVETGVATLLELLAKTWPADVDAALARARIDSCFVGGNAIRLELAERLPPGEARNTVLDEVLRHFDDQLGLREAAPAFEEYFLVKGPEIVAEIRIATRAFVLRHEQDKKSVGRKAGQRIARLSNAARALLERPFARARNHARHQSAIARLACALTFVLEVAKALAIDREAEAKTLAALGVEHAGDLLRMVPDDEWASPYVEQLACVAVWTMRDGLAADKRGAWALDAALQPFVRALAAWTDPSFVSERREYAEDLFKAAGHPALDMRVERFGYDAALTLLDAALATHRSDPSAIQTIRAMWSDTEANFAPYGRDPWPARALLDAASAMLPLKADPALRHMLMARLC